jgi:uncharacterized flavoprotein (TIGR03862 family)
MKRVAVIGAGPAGLMAAETLAGSAQVTVYDRMPSAGRKLLMAGRGGLNLTHGEPLEAFLARYRDAPELLRDAIRAFPPDALRAWSEALGQQTFVGSSGRVFPRAMKASPLLRAWLRRLDAAGVTFALRHHWVGWDDGRLSFETPGGPMATKADATVLALGGASWPRLGSDGGWADTLVRAGVAVAPLQPSNCGFLVAWSELFRRFAGQPLKRIALSLGTHVVRGEAVITATGLEGGAIYALSGPLRDAIAAHGEATLHVALRPDMNDLERRLAVAREKRSISTFLRKALSLSPAEIGLLQEVTHGKLSTLPPGRCASPAPRRSRARSRPRAACASTRSTRASCCALRRACSLPARCSTGKRRPAAICCRRVSLPASPPGAGRWSGCGRTAPSVRVDGRCNALPLAAQACAVAAQTTSPAPGATAWTKRGVSHHPTPACPPPASNIPVFQAARCAGRRHRKSSAFPPRDYPWRALVSRSSLGPTQPSGVLKRVSDRSIPAQTAFRRGLSRPAISCRTGPADVRMKSR